MLQWFCNRKDRTAPRAAAAGKQFERGLTLVELVITFTILAILSSVAARVAVIDLRREKEEILRRDLWEIRNAIDKYKDACDNGMIMNKVLSEGYPPDLETLVNGVDIRGSKTRFLRRIPADPMTGRKEWGLRSVQDDLDSDTFGGQNVFDVYSKSQGISLDGTKYSDW
jgi:general secretion pathway protein G